MCGKVAKKLFARGNGAQKLSDFGSEMCGEVAEKLSARGNGAQKL
jgi:hypothetical protein